MTTTAQLRRNLAAAGNTAALAKLTRTLREPLARCDGTEPVCVTIPGLKMVNPLNGSHGHWTKGLALRNAQRTAVTNALMVLTLPALPVRVTITRLYRDRLKGRSFPFDDDAVPASGKRIRDTVAKLYGIDDADPRIRFVVEQEGAAETAVRVRIERVTQ